MPAVIRIGPVSQRRHVGGHERDRSVGHPLPGHFLARANIDQSVACRECRVGKLHDVGPLSCQRIEDNDGALRASAG